MTRATTLPLRRSAPATIALPTVGQQRPTPRRACRSDGGRAIQVARASCADVESPPASPFPALRAVPLPRFAGEDDHFAARLAAVARSSDATSSSSPAFSAGEGDRAKRGGRGVRPQIAPEMRATAITADRCRPRRIRCRRDWRSQGCRRPASCAGLTRASRERWVSASLRRLSLGARFNPRIKSGDGVALGAIGPARRRLCERSEAIHGSAAAWIASSLRSSQ